MIARDIKTIIIIVLMVLVLPPIAFGSKAKDREATVTFLVSGNLEGHIEGRKG